MNEKEKHTGSSQLFNLNDMNHRTAWDKTKGA